MSTKLEAAQILMNSADPDRRLEGVQYVFDHTEDGSDEKLEAAQALIGLSGTDRSDGEEAASYVLEYGEDE